MSTNAEQGLLVKLPRRPSILAEPARFVLRKFFSAVARGHLVIRENGCEYRFGQSVSGGVHAEIDVKRPVFWVDLLLGGSVGACESYISGSWNSPELTDVFRLFLNNRNLFVSFDKSLFSFVFRLGNKLFHLANKNTQEGSRNNIAAHYDLGNDFYQQFLDPTMTYSSGIFRSDKSTLEQAQNEKYDRLCRKLGLKPEHSLIEIGTGWGGMAEHAAKYYGCNVTTTTISKEQHAWAVERISCAGLKDRVTVLLEDYRNLSGKFDRLVSIEMIEAVGFEFLPVFFGQCRNLIKDDGLMAVQAITILDREFNRHVGEVDFIKRYIFPGSCLTSVSSICEIMTQNTDLQLVNLEDISSHYARTLRCWLNNFRENLSLIRELGFDDQFLRLWELYLQYCEAGFAEHYIGDIQIICAPPSGAAKSTGLLI